MSVTGFLRTGFLLALALLGGANLKAQTPPTLGDALDATNLVWTTGGYPLWFGQSTYSHDGKSAAACYLATSEWSPNSWLKTTATGPGAVTFWWNVSCSVNEAVGLQFSIDTNALTKIKGDSGWQRRSFFIPPGSHTLKWSLILSWGGLPLSNAGFVDGVALAEPTLLSFASQPTNQSVMAGTSATLAATLDGTEPWAFQWLMNGQALAGATNDSLVVSNAQATASGNYQVVVTNPLGAITSQVAVVTVTPSAPVFTLQPAAALVALSSNLTLTAAATGTEPITWQWYFASTLVPDATNRILTLTNLQFADSGNYAAVASNPEGSATSAVATVTVADVPVFSLHPASQGVPPGATARFTAAAVGAAPVNYQWYFEGVPVSGATASTAWMTNAGYGNYRVVAANSFGSATSAVATLSFSSLTVWGRNSYDLDWVPPDATNVIAVTGGDDHLLALRSDGRVVGWGANYYNNQATVPPTATNVIAVAAGSTHSLALREDGSVLMWGGALATGRADVPPEATNVVALARGCGSWHCVALRADGTVVDWGFDRYGWSPVPPSATNVVAVAAGHTFSGALRADGSFVAWGRPGQWTNTPTAVTNVDELEAQWASFTALRQDERIVEWSWWSTSATLASNYIVTAAGGEHVLGLQLDGKVKAWGANSYQQTNVPPWVTNAVTLGASSRASAAVVGTPEPFFSQQPRSCVAVAGDNVRFIASVRGAHPMRLQWYRNNSPLPGASRRWLILDNVQSLDGAGYTLVASNAYGSATSKVVQVGALIPSPPRIVALSTNAVVPTNGTLRLEVSAAGTEPMQYRWLLNGSPLADGDRISGAESPALSVRLFRQADVGDYQVAITNTVGQNLSPKVSARLATSGEALADAVDLPGRYLDGGGFFYQREITHDGEDAAQSVPILDNGTASLGLTNAAATALSFWWKVSSETNADYLRFTIWGRGIEAAISGESGWQQRSFWMNWSYGWSASWRFTKNASGSAGQDCGWVDQIRLGPATAPSLAEIPKHALIFGSTPVTLSAAVQGSSTVPLTYRWYRVGTASPVSESSMSYQLSNNYLTPIAGQYFLTVSNVAGVVTSPVANVIPSGATNQPTLARLPNGTTRISWVYGTLESASRLEGPWATVPGATSPYTMPLTDTNRFFRVRMF